MWLITQVDDRGVYVLCIPIWLSSPEYSFCIDLVFLTDEIWCRQTQILIILRLTFNTSVVHCVCAQTHPTLCDPRDYSLPGPSVHDILQARIQSRLPLPPPPGLELSNPVSLALQEDSLPLSHWGNPNTSVG